MKIKVAIDLTPLYSKHQFRGIGFYTKRLVEALKKLHSPEFEFEFIKSADKLQFLELDLIHYPYFTPFFFSLPTEPLVPSVVTIHDLIPIKHMANFSAGVKGRIRWEIQKRRLKKVEAIITDSQFWKKEINQLTGYSSDKIFSIPLAAGEEFKLIEDRKQLARVKDKYQLPDDFVLYVGDVNWNKNIFGLIKAFYKLKTTTKNLKLVLVGKAFEDKGLKETKEILQLISAKGGSASGGKGLNLINQIKILGFMPTEDLVPIYNLATVYCQPSFSEGFGLSVLEAMACGCPVVAANTSSLPEVCGKAAVMIDPYDINNIARELEKVIGDTKIRDELKEKGLKWVKNFSWEKAARETIKVYEKIFKQRK